MSLKSLIRLFIPFKTVHTSAFRLKLMANGAWEMDKSLDTGFYLGYIDRIFNKNGIHSDCLVMKTLLSDHKFNLLNNALFIESARIFSFDTSVSILELSIPCASDSFDVLSNITSALRLSNQKNLRLSDGTEASLNSIAENLLKEIGNVSLFEHLGASGETRPELFVSVVSDSDIENIDMHAYRIASGLDDRYDGEPVDSRFYSNFSYIKWAITKRGICNIGIKNENPKNCEFIENNWLNYTDTRYIIWYILVLHQKYALYQYMNDIANKSSWGNLREFQKKIMVFNTKYRFSIVSEETSYQKLYEIMSEVKGLENEFNDIDEEISRISDYNEASSDKRTTIAMTIISILCAVSAVEDLYSMLLGKGIFENIFTSLGSLTKDAQVLFVSFLILVLIALLIVLPTNMITRFFKKCSQKILEISLKKKTK